MSAALDALVDHAVALATEVRQQHRAVQRAGVVLYLVALDDDGAPWVLASRGRRGLSAVGLREGEVDGTPFDAWREADPLTFERVVAIATPNGPREAQWLTVTRLPGDVPPLWWVHATVVYLPGARRAARVLTHPVRADGADLDRIAAELSTC